MRFPELRCTIEGQKATRECRQVLYNLSGYSRPIFFLSLFLSLSLLFLFSPSFPHSVSFRIRFLCLPLLLFALPKSVPFARAHRNPVICSATRKLSTVGRKGVDRNRPKLWFRAFLGLSSCTHAPACASGLRVCVRSVETFPRSNHHYTPYRRYVARLVTVYKGFTCLSFRDANENVA